MSMYDYVAPGRKYSCPIYSEDFYFIYITKNTDGTMLNETIPKKYPEYSEIVGYLYLRCDEHGKKLFNVNNKRQTMAEIEKLEDVQRFDEHLLSVLKFMAGIGQDDQLLSSMEGSIDAAKKPSSKTAAKG